MFSGVPVEFIRHETSTGLTVYMSEKIKSSGFIIMIYYDSVWNNEQANKKLTKASWDVISVSVSTAKLFHR